MERRIHAASGMVTFSSSYFYILSLEAVGISFFFHNNDARIAENNGKNHYVLEFSVWWDSGVFNFSEP